MQKEMALLWEVTFFEFLIVTVVIGGALAYAIGRSTARSWSGWGLMVFYCLLLAVAIRFLHFSLFHGTFFLPAATLPTALHYAVIDFAVILAVASLGRGRTRAGQMARQYRFEKA
ncbi:DUF6867 family protein [Aureimonas phyllosphaerae]|uniref:DUF6867 domain-containing protein n=1 Tax=Aureimonas phyllosphaerae TaxID=1166078 RepID=A0A7W6FU32_9HYPH|nr:hypothetical protein [Aureimonas phyllosphaerae]MBB3934577.1 hypothetical protein [Aureimonas phyllosphaerae]MBB3958207.1 hypothetical protein [Aureimonas phyllosphaerae]SFE93553.1 hypothetical protein SAMN05216566_101177 [Aureimonas phyllosphaerae]